MATGVVDDFKTIEIKVKQRIGCFPCLGTFQRAINTTLEFAAINQSGQDVMARVIAEATIKLTRLTDIMEYQHTARNFTLIISICPTNNLYVRVWYGWHLAESANASLR